MGNTIVFTGGGSGGHVFPGLAVMEELAHRWAGDFLWIGSGKGIERDIVTGRGVPYEAVPTGKLRREISIRNVGDAFRVIGGIARSYAVLRRIRPAALFSKGGYVSVPPVIAAHLLHIPVLTHESDSDPGLATRINARFADRIFVPYQETIDYFPSAIRSRVSVTGNPVRTDVLRGDPEVGRRFVGAPAGMPILLVVGGSLGARQINALIADSIGELAGHFFVVHQTGSANVSEPPAPMPNYHPVPFIREEFGHVLQAADLVVSRAGAGSLWEIAVAGKPSILVPLSGTATRGDQVRNARLFAAHEAALVLEEPLTSAHLAELVLSLAGDVQRRRKMGEAARRIGRTDAAAKIAEEITALADAGSDRRRERS